MMLLHQSIIQHVIQNHQVQRRDQLKETRILPSTSLLPLQLCQHHPSLLSMANTSSTILIYKTTMETIYKKSLLPLQMTQFNKTKYNERDHERMDCRNWQSTTTMPAYFSRHTSPTFK